MIMRGKEQGSFCIGVKVGCLKETCLEVMCFRPPWKFYFSPSLSLPLHFLQGFGGRGGGGGGGGG